MALPYEANAMKTILHKSTSVIIMFFGLVTAISCTPNAVQQSNIAASKTSTRMSEETLIVTPTLENTFQAPIPTLSIYMEQGMVESLESSKCNLPCYMGITPGKTTWGDAKTLLESLGAKFQIQGVQGNGEWVDYLILIDDPSIRMTDGTVEDHRITHDIALLAFNGVVQKIRVWIQGRGVSPKFQDYWSRYTPKGVFLQMGAPDEVYSASGLLALVYKEIGIFTYETFWKEGQLCPQYETGYFDRRFEIINPDSAVAISSEFQESLKYVWKPIEESLGVSIQEFYDQVVSNDSVCFEIK